MPISKKTRETSENPNKILRENKEIFRDFFDQSAMGEAIVDLKGTYLDVNDRFCSITGYSKKELMGKSLSDVTHPEDAKKTFDILRDILLEKIPFGKLEKRYIRKDKKIIWGFLSITLFRDKDNDPKYFIAKVQDITEFKEIELGARSLQKKYATIVEKGNDGIIIIQDFLIKFANQKILEWTGYTADEIDKKDFLSFISEESSELIKENYIKRMAGKKVGVNYKVKIVRKDGKEFPVEVSGSVIDYEGKPADMVFLRDITDREKAEEEFKKYKFIFDQSNQEIAIAGLDRNLVIVNESFAKNHGYTIKELIGKNISILHPKEELPKVEKALKSLEDYGQNSSEIIQMKKDGSTYVTLMDNFVLNIDSKPKYFVGMAIDITKMREAEDDLKRQKSLLDSIVRSTNDGLLVVDRQGKISFYNEKFKNFWQIPTELIKIKDDKKLLEYVVEQLSNPKEFLDKISFLYENPEEESYDVINFKDGRIFERYSIAQKIGNDIVGRIWSFRDITEKNRLAAEEKERVIQIEKINRLAIGRELKMIELKNEIANLKKKIKNQ